MTDPLVLALVHLFARALEGLIYGALLYAGLLLLRPDTAYALFRDVRTSRIPGYALLLAASIVFWLYPWQLIPDIYQAIRSGGPPYQPFGIVIALATVFLGFYAGQRIYTKAFEDARDGKPSHPESEQLPKKAQSLPVAAPSLLQGVPWTVDPNAHFRSLVGDATLMLHYATENAFTVPDDVINAVQAAQTAPSEFNVVPLPVRSNLERALRDLAKLIAPVTAETLKATSDSYPWKSLFALGDNRPISIVWSRKLSTWTLLFVIIALSGTILDSYNGPIPGADDRTRDFPRWLQIPQIILHPLVPFTYGAIGACIALLKACQAFIHMRQFDPRRIPEYYNRMILGAVSGGMIVILIAQLTTDGGAELKLSEAALGFLAGYNSDLLFSAIERISTAILPRVGIETVQRDKGAPRGTSLQRPVGSTRRTAATVDGGRTTAGTT